MKRLALILCILGFASLVVGSLLAIPSVRSILFNKTIRCTGTVRYPDELPSQAEASLPQPTSDQTNLDKIGYLAILGSIGFFTVGLVVNRKKD